MVWTRTEMPLYNEVDISFPAGLPRATVTIAGGYDPGLTAVEMHRLVLFFLNIEPHPKGIERKSLGKEGPRGVLMAKWDAKATTPIRAWLRKSEFTEVVIPILDRPAGVNRIM